MYKAEVKQALADVWAKSKDSSGETGLSLLQHTDNVVKQMGQFLVLYEKELKQLSEINLPRILLYGALMHDFGKIHPGFQNMLITGKKYGHRHEILSLGFLEFLDIPEEEKSYLAAAIAFHHKGWLDLTQRSPSYFMPKVPFEKINTIQELLEGLQLHHIQGLYLLLQNAEQYFLDLTGIKISPYTVKNNKLTPEGIYKNLFIIHQLINSFISGQGFRRKINRSVCHYATITRGFILSADHLASAKPMKLIPGFVSINQVLKGLKRNYELLYHHQKELSTLNGSQILIAPTGSGKTEAALLWAGSVREKKKTRGRLFFILPYRASINAMVIRLQRIFGEKSTAAVHGKTLVQCYMELMEKGYTHKEAQKVARYQESLSRLNTTPIRVCTPYQLLKTFFAPKGYEALICSSLGAQLVFDEIHAYDPEVTAMSLVTAKYMKNVMDAECLFMSATMPAHLREVLYKEFSLVKSVVPPLDYYKTRHRLRLIDNSIMEEKAIEQIIEASKQGSVLVVANRVSRAIIIGKRLCEAGLTDVKIIHGRFCPKDRSKKEEELQPRPGKVLISTQVVEVSLDIDYDTVFTELAPLESLLQRFGRVNRKGQKKIPSIVNVFTNFDNNINPFSPYQKEHLHQVLTVLREYIANNPSGEIKESEIQELLDKSYPQYLKGELFFQITQKMEEFDRYFIKEMLPLGVMENDKIKKLTQAWDDLFDGKEVLPYVFLDEARQAATPLDINNLLVTISNKQLAKLKKEEKVWWDEKLKQYITNCEYNYEYGLII
ncbi:CRISPR-associated helicase/endonuclease Cas3 [Desulforamulus hydrothermalis]|uniref:CRISPR-associated helicase Cas3 n=1 Tax=Desulforamulus hydrothermalis Lam5 = DSM 18033 TaxID=1121428 RepID=K8DYA8_9FIRM|nr:CRISPR-associated helicase/endonuclease Cas3 [Desulforamulus hydrothermalis]CCO07700.1 CRISPR-associated helicase Cas3 [Desulforamulus hydrothermalis Lam5 = DSM 18033]SHH25630.1 CRISPR-associated helicase, Cas3 family [Desulforamulus hydrothermalis Lam5 = DSM 18033]